MWKVSFINDITGTKGQLPPFKTYNSHQEADDALVRALKTVMVPMFGSLPSFRFGVEEV